MNDQKRFILAIVLSGLVMAYYLFVAKPMTDAAQKQAQEEIAAQQPQQTQQVVAPAEPVDRSVLIAKGTRIKIDTPALSGSFLTTGSRFDDLRLKHFKQTIEPDSETVVLLSPEGAEEAAYVFDNWTTENGGNGNNTPWAIVSGDTLTVETPITLQFDSENFSVRRVVSIDENYLITLDDTVTNTSNGEIALVRSGASVMYKDMNRPKKQDPKISRRNTGYILHQGPLAVIDDVQTDLNFTKTKKKKNEIHTGESGWVGITGSYWLAAAIAPQDQQMTAKFSYENRKNQDVFESRYTLDPVHLNSGDTIQSKGYIYGGAKSHELLKEYTDNTGIARLDLAVDYGRLRILTRPMSWGLTTLGKLTGNFGVAILLMTLILKIFLFPLNNKAYSSMAKMRALQPKLKKMKERYGEDRVKLQQETMALYKKEGVSPVAGCLPMIPQMFIFFALYKSLFITFEMRHAPFVGWLKDLSARDPLSMLNGFGLFPWDGVPFPALAALAIGPLALLYGITMAMMQTLNPPPADKMQARIMQFMPLFFMFIMAKFASGLLLYWVWNNILTLFQQYYITKKNNVDTPLDAFFGKIFGKKAKAANKK